MACSILFGDTRALSNKYKLYKHINAAFTTYRSGVHQPQNKLVQFPSLCCLPHPPPPPTTTTSHSITFYSQLNKFHLISSLLTKLFTASFYSHAIFSSHKYLVYYASALSGKMFFFVWPWQRSECHSTVAAFCSGANLAPQDHSDAINYTGEKQAGIFISSTHLVHKSINIDRIAIKNEQHLPSTVICS